MPAHLIKRADCGGTFYLVDGDITKSLKTKTKRYAEAKLREYLDGKFGLLPVQTVQQFYSTWIESKIEPLVRRALIRDYRQHFACYILPKFKDVSLAEINTATLKDFQVELVKTPHGKRKKGLAVKTARNIIDSSFRALYRDARAEIEELMGRDPFVDLKWSIDRAIPNPFTVKERDTLLSYVKEHHIFFYPWIFTQFHTGMRPSESTALRLKDIDFEQGIISINKSRYLRAIDKTKTHASKRVIVLPVGVMELIKSIRLPWETSESPVFYNRLGGAITASDWAGKFWKKICKKAGVNPRKFYCTRHTFITEALRRGENPKAVADHCGTSLEMIQRDYASRFQLNIDPTILRRTTEKAIQDMVVPTGFEPVLPT